MVDLPDCAQALLLEQVLQSRGFLLLFLDWSSKRVFQVLQELQNRRKPIKPILSQLEDNVDGSVLQ